MLQETQVRTMVIERIEQSGRAGMSELLADVLPQTGWKHNDFIDLLEDMDSRGATTLAEFESRIMAACINGGGPRYQMFTYSFTPANVNYDDYRKSPSTKRGAGEEIKLSDRVRSDRKSQVLTGKVEYVSGWNLTQEDFEGPYAVISLRNGETKVRIIGGDSTMLKIGDIVSVEVGNPKNVERGMWNTTMEAVPTVLAREQDAPSVAEHNDNEPTVTTETQPPQKTQVNHLETSVLEKAAVLRWQRPTNDDKLADKLGITKEQVVELTAVPEYVEQVEQVLLDSMDTPSGKIKMKNYIRMATQYRKVCVKQALARKMHIPIASAESVFERVEAKL